MEALDLNFGDSIKSGKDSKDTYKKMLMQIRDCSSDRADAIVSKYPTLKKLYDGFFTSGRLMLNDIIVSKISSATTRRIGDKLSIKIYDYLMGDDPNELVVK